MASNGDIFFLQKRWSVGRVVFKTCAGFSTAREKNKAKGGVYDEEEPRSLGGDTFRTATPFGGSRGRGFQRSFRS